MAARITLTSVARDAAETRDAVAALTLRVDALITALTPETPAKVTAPVATPEEEKPFVTWLKASHDERAARKETNAQAATWLRAKGLPTGGSVWAAYKAGERRVRTLKALAAADKAARA